MKRVKDFIRQVKNYFWIRLSILAKIDDFSCSPDWDKNKSIWENAKTFDV